MGNINSKRDWGHAKDYVYIQWLMLQQENPEDFVISTGVMHSVREFIELCALELGWNKNKEKRLFYGKVQALMKQAREQILEK